MEEIEGFGSGGEIEDFSRDFSARDVSLTRKQADIRKRIKDLKSACTYLEDDEEAVQCMNEAKQFEDSISDVFRSESSERRIERVSQEEEIDVF